MKHVGDDDGPILTVDGLAEAMPRFLIAEGLSEGIAADWILRMEQAATAGRPVLPWYPLEPTVREGLFEARQARQVVRGLEGAQSALESQDLGLSKAAATRPGENRRRISRLLVVSGDGSQRFYRDVARLRHRFQVRLEVVGLECDESELGAAAFGEGRYARALMIDHKDSVIRFLTILGQLPPADAAGTLGSSLS